MIPFNKPYTSGNELSYMQDAVSRGKISGNGYYTKKCHDFFQDYFGFKKVLLTTSCTDALEMCAILANIQPGDEVIIPSYTFVSTAIAFIRQGAKIVFIDSKVDHPNMDESLLESLITSKTRVIVPVHYAGKPCEMDIIMEIATRYKLLVIEDAAQAICAKFKGSYVGSMGHLAAFSFHETKNIIAGEGGLLVINDHRFSDRAEIIWEKGTNRAEFFRGEVNKYGWKDVGSSFLPSDLIAAFLYGQLENLEEIQERRLQIWNAYNVGLKNWSVHNNITLCNYEEEQQNNAHMFYIICESLEQRQRLIRHLAKHNIMAVFHYISLHASEYYRDRHDGRNLPHADLFSDKLLRLPFFYELNPNIVVERLLEF